MIIQISNTNNVDLICDFSTWLTCLHYVLMSSWLVHDPKLAGTIQMKIKMKNHSKSLPSFLVSQCTLWNITPGILLQNHLKSHSVVHLEYRVSCENYRNFYTAVKALEMYWEREFPHSRERLFAHPRGGSNRAWHLPRRTVVFTISPILMCQQLPPLQ